MGNRSKMGPVPRSGSSIVFPGVVAGMGLAQHDDGAKEISCYPVFFRSPDGNNITVKLPSKSTVPQKEPSAKAYPLQCGYNDCTRGFHSYF